MEEKRQTVDGMSEYRPGTFETQDLKIQLRIRTLEVD